MARNNAFNQRKAYICNKFFLSTRFLAMGDGIGKKERGREVDG
jgi:hypothetical protein